MLPMRESLSDFDHIGRPYLERQCEHCGDWTRLDLLTDRNLPIGDRKLDVDAREWSERPTHCRTHARLATPTATRSRLGAEQTREATIHGGKTVRMNVCPLCDMARQLGAGAVNARLVAASQRIAG